MGTWRLKSAGTSFTAATPWNPRSAKIALWFGGAGELVDWVPANTPWVREA